MVHRLVSLPFSKVNFEKEVRTIKYIARCNNISVSLIEKMIKQKIYRKAISGTSTLNDANDVCNHKKWIRQPFIGKSSYKIPRILQKIGYNVAFYSMFKIRSLSKLKDFIPIWERSGVYRLECRDCNSIYIGQTGRGLLARIKEHESSWRLNKPQDSRFADHLHESGLSTDFFNFKYMLIYFTKIVRVECSISWRK